MTNRLIRRICFLTVGIFLITSCATMKLTMVWKDESLHGTIRKVIVVGAVRQPSIRNFFEDELARQLKSHGVDAAASYTLVPFDKLSDKDLLMMTIRKTGADAALVTRMVDKKTAPMTSLSGKSMITWRIGPEECTRGGKG